MAELQLEPIYEGFPNPHQITGNPHRSGLVHGCCQKNEQAQVGVAVVSGTTGVPMDSYYPNLYPNPLMDQKVTGYLPPTVAPKLADTLDHKFWLRKDFEVVIRLPKDLTRAERYRLGEFIQNMLADTEDEE